MTKTAASDEDTERMSFGSMLKELLGLGCIGFGGGSALIPVFKERLVDTGKISDKELNDAVAVACITPGALPVELASGIGLRARSALGALAAAAAFAAPGVVATLAALAILSSGGEEQLRQVAYLAVGVSGYIISVIARYVAGSARRSTTSRSRAVSAFLIIAVFLLSCRKSLASLVGTAKGIPGFSLGTIEIMALFFFGALWIGPKRTAKRIASGTLPVVVYCLLKSDMASQWEITGTLAVVMGGLMLTMAAVSLLQEHASSGTRARVTRGTGLSKDLLCFALVVFISAIIASLACDKGLVFIANAGLSSILSFGGGDAYIAMADGLFVGNEIVGQDDFYKLIVPVSNALPGSILCKVLAGCGFAAGLETTASTACALIMGAAGFAAAIAMSCATFALGSHLFESLKGSAAFQIIQRYIGCVVSGLLLTVSLGLLHASVASVPPAMSPLPAIALPLIIAACNCFAKRRFNLCAPAAVVLSAIASTAVLNLM